MPRARAGLDHPELELPEARKLWQTEGLFSDHYLKARIRSNPWWPTDEETRPLWEFCKALYEKRYVTCAKNNEAFTRQELIDKILHKLGFAWTDNLRLPETQQDLEPDYILFGNESEKESVIDKGAAHAASSIGNLNFPKSFLKTMVHREGRQVSILAQGDYEALLELLDIDPEKIQPWKTGQEARSEYAKYSNGHSMENASKILLANHYNFVMMSGTYGENILLLRSGAIVAPADHVRLFGLLRW